MKKLFAELTEGSIVAQYLAQAGESSPYETDGPTPTCKYCSNQARSAGGSCSCSDSCSKNSVTWV